MSTPQLRRAEILTQLIAGKLSTTDAAQLLRVSLRQVQRLRRRFLLEGISCVVHGNTGRAPRNRTDSELVERLRLLCGAGGKYHDFNISHLCDLLARHEEIKLARSTLSRLLHLHGLRLSVCSRPEVKRQRRERKSSEGMMLQIDATPFDWLESRAPRMAHMWSVAIVRNDTKGAIPYQIQLNTGSWETFTLSPGYQRAHSWHNGDCGCIKYDYKYEAGSQEKKYKLKGTWIVGHEPTEDEKEKAKVYNFKVAANGDIELYANP